MADPNTNTKFQHFDNEIPNFDESRFHTKVIICVEASASFLDFFSVPTYL